MAGELGECSVQEWKDAVYSEDIGAVAGDYWMAVAKDAASVTEGEAEVARVKDELKKGGNGELSELQFGIARDI